MTNALFFSQPYRLAWGLVLTVLLQACGMSAHPLGPPAIGKTVDGEQMERLLEQPGPVQLQTINSADWSVPLSGLVARRSVLRLREQVYAHVLRHPTRGNYLVDTGVSQQLVDDPGKAGLGWLVRRGMGIEKMKVQKGTASILQDLGGKLSGVFLTHMHIDHISGMPDIAGDVPLYVGPTESTEKNFINLFVHGSTNQLLQGKHSLQEWAFQPEPQGRFDGIVDIFEDGSVFAISVPGHTSGSVAYLVRTAQGPVLLTGDTSHTRWGWEHTVEPGDYTRDNERNLKSLKALKALVERHPQIVVRLGHQR